MKLHSQAYNGALIKIKIDMERSIGSPSCAMRVFTRFRSLKRFANKDHLLGHFAVETSIKNVKIKKKCNYDEFSFRQAVVKCSLRSLKIFFRGHLTRFYN
jgi:hypothetical protein